MADPTPLPAAPSRRATAVTSALSVALVALVWIAFGQVREHAFTAYDLDTYITQNGMVLRGWTAAGARQALTVFHAANWHPLTWWSHMLDVELYGLAPAGHHLTNVALHAATSVLVLWLFVRWTGAQVPSFCVALLFALHPMHVESVAWVVERKDVLSGLFALLFLHAWTSWTRRGGAWRYVLAWLVLALGLMAKPMLITLPCVLLLLDLWPLGRTALSWRQRVLEKLPFVPLMIASAVLTSRAQDAGLALSSLDHIQLAPRLANVVWAWPQYVLKLVWPSGLMPFYPWLPRTEQTGVLLASALAIAALFALAFALRRKAPYVWVGWCWFFGMLVPVIGLVQVGDQSMADRYSYLPSLGLFAALVWGLRALGLRWGVPRVAGHGLVAVLGVVLVYLCHGQVGFWKDTKTLALRGVELAPDVAKWRGMLATQYAEEARFTTDTRRAQELLRAAERELRVQLTIAPHDGFAQLRLAQVLMRLGNHAEAQTILEGLVAQNPRHAQALKLLGGLCEARGQLAEAETWMRKACDANPANAEIRLNLGWVVERQLRYPEAELEYREALRLLPGYGRAEWRLGSVLRMTGRFDEAVLLLEQALRHELPANERQACERDLDLARKRSVARTS